ncbi:MAG: YdeI/OmpD-associated family protein [Bacteroidetes bacterium]|nr:YdeI/OmpD-associated family protein [Bacteroidota bacterium]
MELFPIINSSYQKSTIWWVMNARKEETQLKRLKTLIKDSENGKKIAYLHRKK